MTHETMSRHESPAAAEKQGSEKNSRPLSSSAHLSLDDVTNLNARDRSSTGRSFADDLLGNITLFDTSFAPPHARQPHPRDVQGSPTKTPRSDVGNDDSRIWREIDYADFNSHSPIEDSRAPLDKVLRSLEELKNNGDGTISFDPKESIDDIFNNKQLQQIFQKYRDHGHHDNTNGKDKTGKNNGGDDGSKIDREKLEEILKEIQKSKLPRAVVEAADDQGLDVTSKIVDGERVYIYYADVNGQRVEVLSTSDTASLPQQLEKAQDAKIAEMEKYYHIDISDDGEIELPGDVEAKTRKPNLGELVALNESLRRSWPSNLAADYNDQEVEIAFLESNPRGNLGEYFTPENNPNGQHPLITLSSALAEYDLDGQFETMMHELAHNGHFTAFTSDDDRDQYFEALGWEKGEDGRWSIRTESGELYREYEDREGHPWVRVNDEGKPIDGNGEVVEDIADAEQYRRDDLMKMLDVIPATDYFDYPYEELAEGLVEFRSSAQRRQELMRTNPELYEIIKQIDEDEIDTVYPPVNGESQFIRLPNGDLVPSTEENEAIVMEFEGESKKMPRMNPKHSLRADKACNSQRR